jgi:hypothetical protein
MSFNKVPATQCPKCGSETNTATALSCAVCAHPLGGNIAPVKAKQAFIGKGALSSKTFHLSKNSPRGKSTQVEKNPALLRWIALVLPPLLIGAGYLIGFNAKPSQLSNSILSNDVPPRSVPAPSRVSASSMNSAPRRIPTRQVEVPAKEPLEKLPIPVRTKALKPVKTKPVEKEGVPLQKKTPTEAPPVTSSVKPPGQEAKAKVKPKVKSTELKPTALKLTKRMAERSPSQTNQTSESKETQPIADTPSVVVIDGSKANTTSIDCYSSQPKESSLCRNRKN